MERLTLDLLLEAAHLGGPSALSAVTHLEPAGGADALVAPAKYTGREGATYVFEDRNIDGKFRRTVLIDSRSSVANRIEDAIDQARLEGVEPYALLPGIEVVYSDPEGGETVLRDLELPHRFSDAHVRLGSIDGEPTTANAQYRAARNSTPSNARALFDLSPISVLAGVWDSTRRSNQARFPAAVVGEIIGVVSDERDVVSRVTERSGARIDPIGASVYVEAEVATQLAKGQSGDLSEKKIGQISKQKGRVSAANLGLGAIPPGTEALDGIATTDIIRTYVLSFATLRRLRFGAGAEGDAAIRALLAAMAIAGITRNDAELFVRANCHLVESGPTAMRIDRRGGEFEAIETPSMDEADALFAAALANAEAQAGIGWHGQALRVDGNPEILRGALSDESAE